MKINLNDPNDFNIENVKELIASADDSVNTQFRVTKDGILFLSTDVGNQKLDGIVFRLETNIAFNGYAGIEASQNESWVSRIYEVIRKNWPKPLSTYCDDF